MVEIEVLIAEMSSPVTQGDDQFGLAAPTDKTVARVRELAKQGKLDVMNRIRLTTLDQQAAFVHVGERSPVVTGRTRVPGRPGDSRSAYSMTYENVGTIVGITPRVTDDAIVIELDVEKSRLVPARDGDDDAAVLPPHIATATCQTTVRVANGSTVIVGGMQSQSDDGPSVFLVLVTARIMADGH
jgi:type II secretory pathway component GspD/PulD (secretin)